MKRIPRRTFVNILPPDPARYSSDAMDMSRQVGWDIHSVENAVFAQLVEETDAVNVVTSFLIPLLIANAVLLSLVNAVLAIIGVSMFHILVVDAWYCLIGLPIAGMMAYVLWETEQDERRRETVPSRGIIDERP